MSAGYLLEKFLRINLNSFVGPAKSRARGGLHQARQGRRRFFSSWHASLDAVSPPEVTSGSAIEFRIAGLGPGDAKSRYKAAVIGTLVDAVGRAG